VLATGRRRTRGLTREDVAQLAGVSFKWYSLFESGKTPGVSKKFVERVSTVLRLSATERDHLFNLLGLDRPPKPTGPPRVPAALMRLADAQLETPAAIYSNLFDVLHANALYRRLFERDPTRTPREHNKIWRVFMHPASRREWRNWDAVARRVVSELRYMNGADSQSSDFRELILDLQADPDFRRIWAQGGVDSLDADSDHFEIDVPGIGFLALNAVPMTIPNNPRLFFVVLMSSDDSTAAALHREAARLGRGRSATGKAGRGRRNRK
jgi:transcriptional regulator with XRE-family HTH domain